MKTITIFTPTYNRAHTLVRTYKSLCNQTCDDFEWLIVDDGSTDETNTLAQTWINEQIIPIKYIYKENGGLYTGYNTAYENINTELNVCIDSDDYMPDNAVELIVNHWKRFGTTKYAGIIGLDFNVVNKKPIGGYFPADIQEMHFLEFRTKSIHTGDVKSVFRTDLVKKVSPLIGYPGEKNFNPIYMQLQIDNDYPSLLLNENLCWVDYQYQAGGDSMSKAIFKQYMNSPKSFAKMRCLEMTLKHSDLKNRFRSAIHYVSSCLISRDNSWLKNSPQKFLTFAAAPLGLLLYFYILYKANTHEQ